MATWQIQDAKAHLSEVLEKASLEGPQTITRHGKERAVILSVEEYRTLLSRQSNFKSWLLGGPKVDDFRVVRSKDTGRSVKL